MLRPLLVASVSGALAVTLASPVLAVPAAFEVRTRAVPARAVLASPASVTDGSEAACDDGTAGGTLVQSIDAYYGNRFAPVCQAARIESARFVHYGYGLAGPYAFRLHVVDTTCGEIGVTPVLTTAGAPDLVTTAEVDLSPYGWCVSGEFLLLLEPLTCADGPTGHDCFPAVVVDASTDGDAAAHCATVSVLAGAERQCFAARSADGRYFDFGLRVGLQCVAPECATGLEDTTWSGAKRLYRDPSPASRD